MGAEGEGTVVDAISSLVARPRALLPIVGLAIGSLGANLITFGGDPEIHLVFAKNMLAGHPLQFNPGIFSSGETSPLYLTLLAAVLALTGLTLTTLFMKLFGVASAFGLLWLVLRHFVTSDGEFDLPAYLESKHVDLVLDFPGALADIFARRTRRRDRGLF